MYVQTFRRATVRDAPLNVRQALGSDTLIEATRHIQMDGSTHAAKSFLEIDAAPSATKPGLGGRASFCSGSSRCARGAPSRKLYRLLHERARQRGVCWSGLSEAPRRRLLVCVGPTGVGKTTTLAKLAARAVLALGRSMRVVSLETLSIGAAEQWRGDAELIGLPFDLAPSRAALQRVASGHTKDILLIDIAGDAMREPQSVLAACFAGLRAISHEVLSVLPAGLLARDVERVGSTCSAPRISDVVATHLDATDQVGGVMVASIGNDLPVAYLCNGAPVPEDIHGAAVDQVADAIFPEQA
jgi:flagellar biosynthesis GTPase FlhF